MTKIPSSILKLQTLLLCAFLWLGAGPGRAGEAEPPGLATTDAAGQGHFLPLKSTSVQIRITGGVAESEIVQTFTNDLPQAVEAIYLFPLPASATVTDMELRYADRVVRSVVKEKEEARATYEQAKTEGKKAALVEQQRPNMFTTSVTNFLPGETVQVKFRCIHPLDFADGAYALTFPMTVGPRYVPQSVPAEEADRITAPILSPKEDPGNRLDLKVEIRGLPAGKIESPTHAIQITQLEPGVSEVKLAGGPAVPNADFGLRIALARAEAPVVTTLESADAGSRYVMINLFPPLAAKKLDAPAMPRDVLFLIDTSGSMDGDSISQARAGLLKCLGMLRPQDQFAIMRFSDDHTMFAPELRPANAEVLTAARSYVQGLNANGGTEMQPALDELLGLPGREKAMRIVVFLTDGDVGNEQSLLRLIESRLGNTRLFTFAIGSAPNEYLIREMARQGRGEARAIQSHEDIERVMEEFFRTLATPVLTDVALTWKDARGRKVTGVEFYPAKLPDLFHDRPVRVFAKLPGGFRGQVTLQAEADERRFEQTIPLDAKNTTSSTALEKLFGRARVDDLMVRWLTAREDSVKEEARKEIVATALEHQIITQFTSRVAVEEKISRPPQEGLISGKVPLPLPRGWNAAQFVATATDEPARWLVAAFLAVLAVLCRWQPRAKN